MDGSTVVSRPTALITPPHQQKTNNTSNTTSTTTNVTPLNNSRNGAGNAAVSSTAANDSTNKTTSKIRNHCDSPTNNYDYNSLEEEQENLKLDLNTHNKTQQNQQQQQKLQQSSLLSVDSASSEFNCNKSNGSISGASSNSALGEGEKGITNGSAGSLTSSLTNGDNAAAAANGDGNTNGMPITSAAAAAIAAQSKKRISSSRTPTRKARRIKFYRNGDRFYPGITIPVSNERYRSFESLFEDLTRLLEDNVKIPGAVRNIYTMSGKKISNLEELEDGQSYVCSCNNEGFKKIEYNLTSQSLAQMTLSANKGNTVRLSGGKVARPGSPSKNSISSGISNNSNSTNCANGTVSSLQTLLSERNSVVHPRIVTLIRNGTRPRKIMRLLLNKRNSPSFDHVLTAITQVVRLDTGYVRKVFTLAGTPVTQLADFFGKSDVFFAYGTERVNNPDDFELEANEQRTLQAVRKVQGTAGTTCKGPKPKMPVKKSRNLRKIEGDPSSAALDEVVEQGSNDSGIETTCLPTVISERYTLGPIVGDGNFAVVLKVLEKKSNQPLALKIIDKSKCKGKEHYIDAEVRVMKKLQHPYIISLIMDVDMGEYMYLVLEYVSGGDLFDAITRVTRFSEDQARVMIKHLASAMAYLHSMSIVHRDIKPENLLVELDNQGNVIELKLADFGLACEVTEPLYAVCGTPTYVAPEILMETGYGLKIDVWAAGIILYILLCGFPPFVSPDNEQEPLFDAIIAGVYEFPDPYWSDIGDGVRDLIANMLQNDPDVRFTSEDILDHCWTMNEESEEYAS